MAKAKGIAFTDLLANSAEIDLGLLQEKKAQLEGRRTDLQAELAQVQKELQGVQAQLNAPIRNAVKAAELLGVKVPEEYRQAKRNSGGGGNSNGGFLWETNGRLPQRSNISRAMWFLSKGSNGANEDGRLTSEEFRALVQEKLGTDIDQVKLGEKYSVILPNGREVSFQKVEE